MTVTNKKPGAETQDAEAQAAEWLAQTLPGASHTGLRPAFGDWRAEAPHHARAAREMATMLQSLDQVGEAALEAEFVRELEAAAQADRRRRNWRIGLSSVAAGFAAVLVMAVSLLTGAPASQYFETQKGQRATVHLEDGSVMELNTDTRVAASVAGGERTVTIERGEAFFTVARDEDHPFRVLAGDTRVQVLGTRFSVRMGASSNLISVMSGLVSVAQRGEDRTADEELVRLQAGERADHDTISHAAKVQPVDIGRAFAWRSGKALYDQTPLGDVVADLNRYFKAPLEIADDGLAYLPVTGTFALSDQDAVVDALEAAFSIMAVKRADGVILLYERQE